MYGWVWCCLLKCTVPIVTTREREGGKEKGREGEGGREEGRREGGRREGGSYNARVD